MKTDLNNLSKFTLWLIFVSVFLSHYSCLAQCPSDQDSYIIRHTHSGLVVEQSNYTITAQYYTGSPTQLWQFQGTDRPGVYYIVNKQSGRVLDIRQCAGGGCGKMHVTQNLDFEEQKFIINSNGRISNFWLKGHNLDLVLAKFEAGNSFILLKDNGNDWGQKYHLEKIDPTGKQESSESESA